jgi:hypothetical protein
MAFLSGVGIDWKVCRINLNCYLFRWLHSSSTIWWFLSNLIWTTNLINLSWINLYLLINKAWHI